MSGASFQDCATNKEPMSRFRKKMRPGERNASNTLCYTTIGSGIRAAGSHETSNQQAKHSDCTGTHAENYADYMEISASDTVTGGRSTWTSAETVECTGRRKGLESVEEEEEGSDADEEGGKERGESEKGSIVSDYSTSCDPSNTDSTDLEDEGPWKESENAKESGNTNE